MPKGQLKSGDQARTVTTQHKSPCSDCPWARKSLAGWLGSLSPRYWISVILGDGKVDCHTRVPMQCAGAATFRANICKSPRDRSVLQLPQDKVKVFSAPEEFMKHHTNGKAKSWVGQ